jgi:hypothetical protein
VLTVKDRLRLLAAALLLTILLLPTAARAEFLSDEGLDQTLAPIALYPDSLLGLVLVASTYPDQVVTANQYVKAYPSADPSALSSALDAFNWDQSVKALCSLPDVLGTMANDMNWTNTLGQAFVDQTNDVYDSIQRLRAQAQSTGALKSSGEVVVQTDDSGYIMIGSANPQVVHVPTYDPAVVYGWRPGRVVATTALAWGTVAVLNELFYGSCWDWHGHHIYVGPGYGHCGYYNGRVNPWGGNNVNINIRNNIHNNIHNGNTNWKPGTRPGPHHWHGRDGYPQPDSQVRPRPGGDKRPDARPTRPENRPDVRPGGDKRPDARPTRPENRPDVRPGGDKRPDARPTKPGNRPDVRPGGDKRPDARPTRPENRPDVRPGGDKRPDARPTKPGNRPTPNASRPQNRPTHGLDVGSGSRTRQEAQRGQQSRSAQSRVSKPSARPQAPRSSSSGGRRR